MQADARQLARMPGVLWVGRRESKHKLSPALSNSRTKPNFLLRLISGDDESTDDRYLVLLVILVPGELRGDLRSDSHDTGAQAAVSEWNRAWEAAGLTARAVAVSDDKAYLHITSSAGLAGATEWLAARPEVLWLEERPGYGPLNAASKRLLSNGPDSSSRTIPDGGGSKSQLAIRERCSSRLCSCPQYPCPPRPSKAIFPFPPRAKGLSQGDISQDQAVVGHPALDARIRSRRRTTSSRWGSPSRTYGEGRSDDPRGALCHRSGAPCHRSGAA